jgi:PPE-repeat protein
MTTTPPAGAPPAPEQPQPAPSVPEMAPPTQPAAGPTPPPAVPPTEQGSGGGRSNRLMYWIIAAVVVILVIIGLATWNRASTNQEAQQKAQQLSQKFEQNGLPVPADLDTITRSFGTDGGAVCDNPANALGKAALNDLITNGADFVGRRPIIIDRRILLGEALILQTYCPDKLKPYQDKILKLKTANTVKQ